MKLMHVDNACCIYEAQGFKLLCDPWLTDGAFEGSWFHYPPLLTTFQDIKNVDAIYISHLHPDHYDETVLKQFAQSNPLIPLIVLDHGANFLHQKLSALGFTNLVKVKDKETITIGPMEVTLYAPFVKHPFDNCHLGNFIDSALVVEANGKTILNANDNTPSLSSGEMLLDRHGSFNLVQLKDSLASPYPSCFLNLQDYEKISEAEKLIKRQLTAMCEVAKILKAEWFQPFAGDYQLGGKLVKKNRYLGVAARSYSAHVIANAGIKPLILNEKSTFDLVTGELKASYKPLQESYDKWAARVSQIKYEYENDPEVIFESLLPMLIRARNKLQQFQDRYQYYPAVKVAVNDFIFDMNLSNPKSTIKFIMDNRILKRILERSGHWNNFEVGCHIDIEREPNVYDPDLVNAMCFFHV